MLVAWTGAAGIALGWTSHTVSQNDHNHGQRWAFELWQGALAESSLSAWENYSGDVWTLPTPARSLPDHLGGDVDLPSGIRDGSWGEVVSVSIAAGFPLRAYAGRCELRFDEMSASWRWRVTSGIPVPLTLRWWGGHAEWFLPTRPLWGGLLLNTAIYAVVVMALRTLATTIMRRWRHSRGRCRTCGYPVVGGGTGMCPECGEMAARGRAVQ